MNKGVRAFIGALALTVLGFSAGGSELSSPGKRGETRSTRRTEGEALEFLVLSDDAFHRGVFPTFAGGVVLVEG